MVLSVITKTQGLALQFIDMVLMLLIRGFHKNVSTSPVIKPELAEYRCWLREVRDGGIYSFGFAFGQTDVLARPMWEAATLGKET